MAMNEIEINYLALTRYGQMLAKRPETTAAEQLSAWSMAKWAERQLVRLAQARLRGLKPRTCTDQSQFEAEWAWSPIEEAYRAVDASLNVWR
jgi:hypothetical protein